MRAFVFLRFFIRLSFLMSTCRVTFWCNKKTILIIIINIKQAYDDNDDHHFIYPSAEKLFHLFQS